jgi:hypothetical protein
MPHTTSPMHHSPWPLSLDTVQLIPKPQNPVTRMLSHPTSHTDRCLAGCCRTTQSLTHSAITKSSHTCALLHACVTPPTAPTV